MSTLSTSSKKPENFRVLKASQSGSQIICFPYVGGNANSFFQFAKSFPIDVEILGFTPPGHMGAGSVLIQDMDVLADFCLNQLAGAFKERVIFLGYSMGAMLAYRIVQKLYAAGKPLPELLIMSATVTPEDFATRKDTSQLDDEGLLSYLDDLGGLDPVIKNNQEIMNYFLPILRTDFRMIEYNQIKKEQVPIPAAIIYGTQDHLVVKNMDSWKEYISSQIKIYAITDGHMFIRTNFEAFCQTMATIFTDFKLINEK